MRVSFDPWNFNQRTWIVLPSKRMHGLPLTVEPRLELADLSASNARWEPVLAYHMTIGLEFVLAPSGLPVCAASALLCMAWGNFVGHALSMEAQWWHSLGIHSMTLMVPESTDLRHPISDSLDWGPPLEIVWPLDGTRRTFSCALLSSTRASLYPTYNKGYPAEYYESRVVQTGRKRISHAFSMEGRKYLGLSRSYGVVVSFDLGTSTQDHQSVSCDIPCYQWVLWLLLGETVCLEQKVCGLCGAA